ncbi:Hsp70 family protein [Glycomyces arizonensis]|uniref:Hsp70 family protein n=1 Tax=Glycomyces arizonensis TaxID=256035 RepID=UPI000403837B|nr:Hsp70 family protein [Glycomyces arizonensis]
MSNLNPRPASISVDFGTSHTVASIRRADGRVHQQLFDGSPQLPSAVFMNDEGGPEVGTDAIHNGRRKPERYEPNPKRRIDDGTILLGETELPVTSVIAAVLSRVARECEQTLGGLGSVTVTVPAAWGPTRRHVVADAATAAGLGKVALVPEPVAAASHFVEALGNEVPVGSGVVVYDLGGGTFDATVLRRSGGGFDVLAVDGADDLGGLDFDQALAEHLASSVQAEDERWQRLTAPTESADLRHRTAFLEEVRQAKERLSRSTSTDLTIPLLDIDAHLTRDELETVAAPLIERTVRITQGVIRESGLPKEQIAGLFLVGAASRMPLVATMLHRELGIAPAAIEQPELAVSEGGLVAQALTSSPQSVPSPALPPQVTSQPAGPTVPMAAGSPTPGASMQPGMPMPTPAAPMPTPPHMTGPIQTPAHMAGSLPPAPNEGGVTGWLKSTTGMITVGAAGVAVVLLLAVLIVPGLMGDSEEDPSDPDQSNVAANEPSEDADEPTETDGSAAESEAPQAGTAEGSDTVSLESATVGDVVALGEGRHTGAVTAMETGVANGVPVAVTGGEDYLIRVWNLETGKLIDEYRGHQQPVSDIAITADGDRPVVISTDGYEEHVWYLDDFTAASEPRDANTGTFSWVGQIDSAPAYADDNSFYQLFTGEDLDYFSAPYAPFLMLMEVDGQLRGVGVEDDRVFVAELENGEYVGGTFDQLPNEVVAVETAVIAGKPVMLTATDAGAVQGWDLSSAEAYGTAFNELYQTVAGLSVADLGGGTTGVLVRGSEGLSLFDLDTGQQIGETFGQLTGEATWVSAETSTIDGHPVAVAASSDGSITVFSLER